MPRFQRTTVTLLGRSFEVLDVPRFIENKSVLFDMELYRFTTTEDIPRIIDCGASIGLTSCYFKHLYPKSDIVAFEPDPRVFEVLKRNCAVLGGTRRPPDPESRLDTANPRSLFAATAMVRPT